MRFMNPSAGMATQSVSEPLADLGSVDAKRGFMVAFLGLVAGRHGPDGLLIDSTGIPNSYRLAVTAVSNHNGRAERRSGSYTWSSAARA